MGDILDTLAEAADIDRDILAAEFDPYREVQDEIATTMAEDTATLPDTYDDPVYNDTAAAPVFISTSTSPLDVPAHKLTSPWTERFSILGSPIVHEHEDMKTGPLTNWISPEITPASFEAVKEQHDVGDTYDQAAIYPSGDAWAAMDEQTRKHLIDDETTAVIDPPSIRRYMRKDQTALLAEDHDLPHPPTTLATAVFEFDDTELQAFLGDNDRVLTKPIAASRGDDVTQHADINAAETRLASRQASSRPLDPERYVVQPYLPHKADIRTIVADETIIGAERRNRTPADHRSNLSLLDDAIETAPYLEEMGKIGKAYHAYRTGKAEPLKADELPAAVHTIIEDTIEAITKETEHQNHTFFGGIDILELEDGAVDQLPDRYQDTITTYSDETGDYALIEIQNGPGTIIDQLHYWEDTNMANSTLGLANLLYEQTGNGIDRDAVAGDDNSQLWRRIEQYYDDLIEYNGKTVPETVAYQEETLGEL